MGREARRIVVGFGSALRYWRAARCGELLSEGFGRPFGAQRLELSQLVHKARLLCREDGPIDLVVPDAAARRHRGPNLRARVWSGPMPADQLERLDVDIYVCKPALAYVQMGALCDEVGLALIAFELTGTYALRSWDDGSSVSLPAPLCDLAELRAFATACAASGVRGARRALSALDMVLPNSNSAAETALGLQMRAKGLRGGFGFKGFHMNAEVKLESEIAELQGCDALHPDAYFPEKKALIEYDSDDWHRFRLSAHARDATRRDSFSFMGNTVYVLTKDQVKDPVYLQRFMEALRGEVGGRAPVFRDARYLELHRRLHVDRLDPLEPSR